MQNITASFQSTNCDNIGILGEGTLTPLKDEAATIEYFTGIFNRMPCSDQSFKVTEVSTYGPVTDECPLGTIRKTEIHGTIRNEGGLFDYWVTITANIAESA